MTCPATIPCGGPGQIGQLLSDEPLATSSPTLDHPLNKDTIWWRHSRRQEHRQILIAWVSCRQPPKTSGSLTEARGDFLRAAPAAEYLRTHIRLQAAPGGSGDGGRVDAP